MQPLRDSGSSKSKKKAVKLISIKKLNLFQLLTLAPYIQPTHIDYSEELFKKLLTFY